MTILHQVLVLLSVWLTGNSAVAACYPGVDCGQGVLSTCESGAESSIPDFYFDAYFVLDARNGLLWIRDIYSIGTTTSQFDSAYANEELYESAIATVRDRISEYSIGGIAGWRLATMDEVQRLAEYLGDESLFAYFSNRQRATGANVIGAVEPDQTLRRIDVIGVQYANHLSGLLKTGRDGLGGAEYNEYGFWMVKAISDSERAELDKTVEPMRVFREPTSRAEASHLKAFQLRRNSAGMSRQSVGDVARAQNYGGNDDRFVLQYKKPGRIAGTAVAGSIKMSARSTSGSPSPVLQIFATLADEELDADSALWDICEHGELINVWRAETEATYWLGDSMLNGFYNGERNLYLCFGVEYNMMSFVIPTLRLEYIEEGNRLIDKARP